MGDTLGTLDIFIDAFKSINVSAPCSERNCFYYCQLNGNMVFAWDGGSGGDGGHAPDWSRPPEMSCKGWHVHCVHSLQRRLTVAPGLLPVSSALGPGRGLQRDACRPMRCATLQLEK